MKKLQQSRFKPIGHYQRVWEIVVEHGVSGDDLLQPGFYAHVGHHLKPQDKIVVMSDDGTLYAELLVLAAERTAATVTFIPGFPFDLTKAKIVKIETDAAAASDFDVKFRGPAAKWSIVRKDDNAVIREGFANKEDAVKSLDDYLKVQAA
jgi:hypothetical protein